MQTTRGTKDILPNEIQDWQYIYIKALHLLSLYDYHEIRTPIIEPTELFIKGVGNDTDIINKEMYSFLDQGKRNITLRPEGTASIARAYISNKLYAQNAIQRLWYMGPMFRYERPQNGRQRQFHQLGIECIGSTSPLADIEVIDIAHNLLNSLGCTKYILEINSIGTQEERAEYKDAFVNYLEKYKNELDKDSQKRLLKNPLRILDSKNIKTQDILDNAPCISHYLKKNSQEHFAYICEYLKILNISFIINTKLVRGLDYYSNTAFEITNNQLGSQKTICGGGRYDHLIKQLGGPDMPGVGWAIGIERLLLTTKNLNHILNQRFYIITQGIKAQKKAWDIIQLLQKNNIRFHLDFSNNSFQKKIKKAIQLNATACLILGSNEIDNNSITIKWLKKHYQETINFHNLLNYIKLKQKN